MSDLISNIEFELRDDVSKNGTALKYIYFDDKEFRLTEDQKTTLKEICKGYFFYSKSKQMWGFTQRGNNEIDVYNYLKNNYIPPEIANRTKSRYDLVRKEPIPFKVEDFEIQFIKLKGRPLFYYENKDGVVEIKINLTHWFFEKCDESEREFAKKIVLSLVGTELEFTSQLIESFFNKLNCIQENLKYSYGKHKS
jgi:hypothetical protein